MVLRVVLEFEEETQTTPIVQRGIVDFFILFSLCYITLMNDFSLATVHLFVPNHNRSKTNLNSKEREHNEKGS